MDLSLDLKFSLFTPVHHIIPNVFEEPRVHKLVLLVFIGEPMELAIDVLVHWVKHVLDNDTVAWHQLSINLNQAQSARFIILFLFDLSNISAATIILMSAVFELESPSLELASFVDSVAIL